MSTKTAVVVIQVEQMDWIKKHPERFVDALISRINMGETDKHPGYARWNGDGIPGVQLVCITEEGKNDLTSVIAAGNGFGIRLGSLKIRNDNNTKTKTEILKKLLEKIGFKGQRNITNDNLKKQL
jgi:hypothetical protein